MNNGEYYVIHCDILPQNFHHQFVHNVKTIIQKNPLGDFNLDFNAGVIRLNVIDSVSMIDFVSISDDNGVAVIEVDPKGLAFLWAVSYYCLILFDEPIIREHENGELLDKEVDDAKNLMKSCTQIIKNFKLWPIDNKIFLEVDGKVACRPLPNPFIYEPYKRLHIESANGIFCCAYAFILNHEFHHYFYGQHTYEPESKEEAWNDEFESDESAAFILTAFDSGKEHFTYAIAILVALLAVAKMNENSPSEDDSSHPYTSDRIARIVEKYSEHFSHDMRKYIFHAAARIFDKPIATICSMDDVISLCQKL